MKQSQDGIFYTQYHCFNYLEYRINGELSVLKEALSHLIANTLDKAKLVIAFGSQCWGQLQPNWKPEELQGFKTITGVEDFSAPSTQGDLFFWIQGESRSDCLLQALLIQDQLKDIAELTLDLPGFTHLDSRDLTGFVDGSANPQGELAQRAALIPSGEIGEGGSYVLTQQWVHNLPSFNHLSQFQQEQVIGRTKPDSVELEGSEMPIDSHVSRTDVKLDNVPQKIYRRSAPYGTVSQHGLYFLGFSCELSRLQIQLDRMYGVAEDGIHDKLIEYSAAVMSSYWFAPAQEDLLTMLS